MNNVCHCMNHQLTTSNNKNSLTKIYYPNPTTTTTNYSQAPTTMSHENRKNNEVQQQQQANPMMQYRQNVTSANKRGINSGNILQYYYNNINNNEYTATNVNNNGEYLAKQSNININNIFAISNNQQKLTLEKNQFSSTIRPLSLKVSTPKQVSNFFTKTFRSDSQKRPLLLNYSSTNNEFHDANIYGPNFKIIPDKTGLKISPIYSISQNIDKYTPRKLRQQSTYFRNGDNGNASSSRPLFVRK